MNNDKEQFEKDLLESIGQMKRGEYARVHMPEQIAARRGRIAVTEEATKPRTAPEDPTV